VPEWHCRVSSFWRAEGAYGLIAFQHHLVRIAKVTALLAAAWTLLCALLIVGWQAISWLQSGIWSRYPLSSAIEGLGGGQRARYLTASSDPLDNRLLNVKKQWANIQAMIDWVLDLPTIVPLLIASVLLLALYVRLAAAQEEYPAT
jgi:hypothetical protein